MSDLVGNPEDRFSRAAQMTSDTPTVLEIRKNTLHPLFLNYIVVVG